MARAPATEENAWTSSSLNQAAIIGSGLDNQIVLGERRQSVENQPQKRRKSLNPEQVRLELVAIQEEKDACITMVQREMDRYEQEVAFYFQLEMERYRRRLEQERHDETTTALNELNAIIDGNETLQAVDRKLQEWNDQEELIKHHLMELQRLLYGETESDAEEVTGF